jgi:hypothetical protein
MRVARIVASGLPVGASWTLDRVLASVSALVLSAACGGSAAVSRSSSSPSPKATAAVAAGNNTLTVEKVGFARGNGRSATDQTTLWNGMALISNQSTRDFAADVNVQITAYGSAGQVVAIGDASISAIRAAQQVGIVSNLSGITVPPIRVVVVAEPDTWLPDPTPMAAILGRNVHLQQDQHDPTQYTASGEMVSTYASPLSDVNVNAVCLDSAGNIIGGGHQYILTLPALGTASVSVTVFANNPAGCQLYGTTE